MSCRALLSLLIIYCCGATCAAASDLAATTETTFISGRVLDAQTDAPIPDVSVHPYSIGPESKALADSVKTDSRGLFLLQVPSGKLVLYCSSESLIYDSYILPMPTLDVPAAGLSGVKIRMSRLQVLTGYVTDMAGAVIRGAVVTAGPPGGNMGALTDDDGRFILTLPSRRKCDPG